jgi:small-conductance mechanosensitive channel
VALAVGFAFRDIAENFIASVMLGIRRPFRVGELIEVAGKSGVVKSLNTRATVLVTLDGSHVRIPNAMIFKDILVNRSASTTIRGSFDVLIPWDSSIATAAEAITNAVREHEGLEEAPSPRTLVEAIEPGGIRLRSYFWFPARGVDRGKLLSDVQFAAKVGLQKVDIKPAPSPVIVQLSGVGALDLLGTPERAPSEGAASGPPAVRALANLQHDTQAASIAASQLPEDQENKVGHALSIADEGIDEEGRSLIGCKDPP